MSRQVYADLKGRAVVVTGGGSGIGAASVRALAAQGARVVFIDIDAEASHALVAELAGAGLQARFELADLTDIDALRGAIASARREVGPIAVLVNNAARDDRHATLDVTPQYFDDRIAVNLKHVFFASQAVLPDMQAAGGGSIINFSSISWMKSSGGMAVYTAAKSAMLGLTRSLARDFGPFNIRVNAIAPGWVLTERQKQLWVTPAAEKTMLEAQCLKRWLIPDDIANFVLFLASDVSSACTAQHYVIDGGWV
jgi:NAD(P)-dependent dehydrogenase (short-subunit alcohol dehydrogenase family)